MKRKTGQQAAGLRRRVGADNVCRSMRRRLLLALGAGALAAPFHSFAQQQGKIWRVGFLSLRRVASLDSDTIYRTFPQGMRELGYVDGKNLQIELRSADGNLALLPGLAAELVQLKLDVIVAAGTPSASAVQKTTSTIPIVIGGVGDPVGSGFVESLARPGKNVTGPTTLTAELIPKHLEMLQSIAHKPSRVAILVNPSSAVTVTFLENVRSAARKVKVNIVMMEARVSNEIEKAFSTVIREKVGAVIVAPDPLFTQERKRIAELAQKYRLPSITGFREFAEDGVLITYGASLGDDFRRAATYVDKILKGAKPADLPVEQPMKFELVINAKTAKALGIKFPDSILVRADKVIE